ncbi:MAG: penicillin-binding protein 1A [Gammaproteobacteria bacterium]|nr:MAG: penicillin-binding protein 1A [Gammaproteobacteria bacterium]
MTHPIFKFASLLIWLLVCAAGGSLIVTGSLYLYLSPKLPSVESLREIKLQTPLRIYSQDSQLIGEFGEMRRNPVTFDQIPQPYIHALLSAEDDRFYTHSGVDINGLLRAASQLMTSGEIKTGGSTITMQVARNFFLTHKQTFTRKFNEILLALRIEDELTKNEILTLYANKIYQGNRAYGIEAAAQVYYGKHIHDLNLAQLAMIAGLPKAPSAYNPLANPNRALIRRNWILKRMLTLDYIDEDTYTSAVNEPVSASYHGYTSQLDAPYVAEMARLEILDMVGTAAYTDGYRVYTTVDSKLQQTAQKAVQTGLIAYDSRHGYRGPEKRQLKEDQWKSVLKETPTLGGLIPAVVVEAKDKSLLVQLSDQEQVEILWNQGLEGLRKFNSPNSRSAPIKSAQDIFAKGDLIRVQQHADSWHLGQLPKAQAALAALDPDNGALKAMVGGFDFQQSHFNRVTQAERQPGSNFKPFIYTTALENGFTPASIINDAPVVFEDDLLESSWRPENDSGKFYGPTRLRQALYLSRNLISIRILRALGINRALTGLERFGFDPSQLPHDLSLALGSHAVTPLKIATGYASFANGGYRIEPFLIERVEDSEGNILYQAAPLTVCRECGQVNNSAAHNEENLLDGEGAETPSDTLTETSTTPQTPPAPEAPRIIDERTAFIIDSILKDVIRKGTGRKALVLKRADIAGKTGTTNGPRDAWFSGYSTHIVTTTWVGFDENQMLGRNEYGGSAALPIWIDFMKTALAGKPQFIRPQPEGIVMARIDPENGLSVGPEHRNAIFEIFRKEDVPPMAETHSRGNTSGNSGDPRPEDLF